jgi:hypothetical protein
MSDWTNALESLVPVIGNQAVKAVADELDDLSNAASDPMKAAVLALVSDAVSEHGVAGIELAEKAVKDLLAGKSPDIDWASPRNASDLVAAMQNAEADRKTEAREFAARVGHALGKIGAVLIKAAIAAA